MRHEEERMDTAAVVLLVLGGFGALFLLLRWYLRRDDGTAASEFDALVADTLAPTWADRAGMSENEVKNALVTGEPAAVGDQIRSMVGPVTMSFRRDDENANSIVTSLSHAYTDGNGSAKADLVLAWDDLPSDVRAEFLRTGNAVIERTWPTG